MKMFKNIFKKKKEDLSKDYFSSSYLDNKKNLAQKLLSIFKRDKIDEQILLQIEELLISADIGINTAQVIMDQIRRKIEKNKITDYSSCLNELKQELMSVIRYSPLNLVDNALNIFLIIGVNGVGKTTTIAKLGHYYKEQNKSVVFSAADTFRAAAIEQIESWGLQTDIPVIKQQKGSDSASVVYDSIQSALAKKNDLLIIDTAGRLHNKKFLMEELLKINRIIKKNTKNANLKKILILDATIGQNGIIQAAKFHEDLKLDGIILTKYDSTSKGGIIISVSHMLQLPVYFLGTGQQINDIKSFDKNEYANELFDIAKN